MTAVAREDGQDRDGLAQLAQAGDQAAARKRDVVRMRRDEDMGHGRPSIPTSTGRPAASGGHRSPTRAMRLASRARQAATSRSQRRVPSFDGDAATAATDREARDRDRDDRGGDRGQRRERERRVIPLRRRPEDGDRQPAGPLATGRTTARRPRSGSATGARSRTGRRRTASPARSERSPNWAM